MENATIRTAIIIGSSVAAVVTGLAVFLLVGTPWRKKYSRMNVQEY